MLIEAERSAAATGMLTACRGCKCKEGALPETFWRKQALLITMMLNFWPAELGESKCLLF